MVNSVIFEFLETAAVQLKAAGWGLACNCFGRLDAGVAMSAPSAGSSERSYVGIDDKLGTYVYIRDNGAAVQVESAALGSCENGYKITAQLRAVAVSSNLQNTAQSLADKLFIDLNNIAIKSTPAADYIEISPRSIWVGHSEIMQAETGGTRLNSPSLSLAAIDFELSFLLKNCKMQSPKLC